MKKLLLRAGVIVAVLGVGWGSYAAYRAHLNLVTLDVRDADLRAVAHSIMWQTWEKILVHREVNGKVTLTVHNAPLERVLQILSEQTSSRWTAVYPLYTSRKSLTSLQNLTLGKETADTNGWSAFHTRGVRLGGGGGPGGGMFGANLRAENQLVSMKVLNKDVGVVALGLERYAQAQVVPEDGTKGIVYMNITDGTMPKAVSQLASQVDRHWTRFYTFEPGFRPRGPSTNDDTFVGGGGPPPEFAQRMEEQFQAQLETMSPEEQKQAQERRQRWQEMRNLTPEQRRERVAQLMADPAVQQQMMQRMVQRLKDTTADQRADRANQNWARKAARMASASNGGGGSSNTRGSSGGGGTRGGTRGGS